MYTATTISHFEFNLDGTWCTLQGAGGLYGGGACHFDPSEREVLERVICRLRSRAIYRLASDGSLRTWSDHVDPSKRINEVRPNAVLGCRAVLSSGVNIAA